MQAYHKINQFFNIIKFNLFEIKDHYDTFLPDELISIISNYVDGQTRIKKLSLVSLQYYHLNRAFVCKCYHLHHYIPKVKTYIKSWFNNQSMYILNFREILSLYIVDNVPNDNKNALQLMIDSSPCINIVKLIEINSKLSGHDVDTIQVPYCNITDETSSFSLYKGLYETQELMDFFRHLDNDKIYDIIIQIRPLLINPIDYFLIKNIIFDTINDPQLLLLVENYLSVYDYKLHELLINMNRSVNLLNMNRSVNLLNMIKTIIDIMNINELSNYIIKFKEKALLQNNYKVWSNETLIFLSNKTGTNKLQQMSTNISPEHQWFFDSL